VLGYELNDRLFDSRQDLETFLFTTVSKPAPELTQSPVQWVTGDLSLGGKAAGARS
jgi:hypothetical protein